MPNVLALTDKKTGHVYTGRGLIDLDERIAAEVFGISADPDKWTYGWMDYAGFRLAFGKTDNVGYYDHWPEMDKIARYLDENFTNSSFYER